MKLYGAQSKKQPMQIVSFSPDRGHCVLIPSTNLNDFNSHLAQMSPEEREKYAPLSLSAEQPIDGGAYYFIGLHRTKAEVLQFLIHVIID